jgi:hypothetical protein
MTLIYPACFYKDDNSESYAVESDPANRILLVSLRAGGLGLTHLGLRLALLWIEAEKGVTYS